MTESTPRPARPDADVLIIGAGPAGLSMACALADAGLRSCLLEAAPLQSIEQPQEDGREIALTHAGRAVLQALGQWQDLADDEIAPLRRAQVYNGGDRGFLGFDPGQAARTRDKPAEQLGFLVANQALRRIAYQGALRRAGQIELRCDSRVAGLRLEDGSGRASVQLQDGSTLAAPLLIAADSRFSSTRRMAGIGAQMCDFGRSVLVCRLAHSQPNQGTAHECFHHGHTLALLPLNGGCSSLVLTLPADQAAAMLLWDEARFLHWVAEQLRERLADLDLGTLSLASPRHLYPLVASYAQRFATQRLALIGDAAVGMHPVTAHGYNFGLYGVQALAALLGPAARQGRDLGDAALLQRYADGHRRRTRLIYEGTNAIVRLYTDEGPAARLLRRGVLQLARRLPPLQQLISAQLTGRAGA